MKAIKLAGLVGMLLASGAMASNVAFTLMSPQDGAILNPLDPISWSTKVDVTGGDSQGLAAYVADLEMVGPGATTLNLATFSLAYDVRVGSGPVEVTEVAALGGAGMYGVTSQGNNATPNKLVGFGAGYGPWSDPWNPTTKKGKQAWGVGLASRKSVMLLNHDGTDDYLLNEGTFLAPTEIGLYTVTLTPGRPNVLKAGLDFNAVQAGEFVAQADQYTGDSFTFTVIPEPVTMLLIASGAGLLLRRRRA